MATQFVSCIVCHRLRTCKTVMLKQTNRIGGLNKAPFIFHTGLHSADGHGGKRGCSFETVEPLLTNMSQQRNIKTDKRVRNNRSKHTCIAQGHVCPQYTGYCNLTYAMYFFRNRRTSSPSGIRFRSTLFLSSVLFCRTFSPSGIRFRFLHGGRSDSATSNLRPPDSLSAFNLHTPPSTAIIITSSFSNGDHQVCMASM